MSQPPRSFVRLSRRWTTLIEVNQLDLAATITALSDTRQTNRCFKREIRSDVGLQEPQIRQIQREDGWHREQSQNEQTVVGKALTALAAESPTTWYTQYSY